MKQNKKMYNLKVDKALREIIPPPSPEELKVLEESIRTNGCETPLVVWRGTIIDGHNRYDICRKYGIPFAVEKKDFATRDEAVLWMVRNQLGRRNLNDYQRAELVMRFEPYFREEARKRMLSGKKANEGAPHVGKTRDVLGKMAGVSGNTLQRVQHLTRYADDETKRLLRSGEISIHKAYTTMKENEQHDSGAQNSVNTRHSPHEMRRPRIPLVFICSPYRGDTITNAENARAYCSFAVSQGCIPFAPHLLFTQFLDDTLMDERMMGLYMGAEMLRLCDELWYFGEPSEGMAAEIELARRIGIPVRSHDLKGTVMHGE